MNIRPSPIAGSWYPGDPALLRRDIARYLDGAGETSLDGVIRALVVPHAGYAYSGGVAAHAFSCLRGLAFDTVAVVSPLHAAHPAPLLTTAYDAYRTPLGLVPVDRDALAELDRALRERRRSSPTPLADDREHALEIELPFLQETLGPFSLLPVMMRDQSAALAEALGQALAEVLETRRALLVASSDLSHFHPQAQAEALDAELLRRLEAFDPRGVIAAEREGAGFACGRGAIAAVLWAARALGATRVRVLHHATSGDVSGDLAAVVGYGAAVVWRPHRPRPGSGSEA